LATTTICSLYEHMALFFLLFSRLLPSPTLFPYTTLFRSIRHGRNALRAVHPMVRPGARSRRCRAQCHDTRNGGPRSGPLGAHRADRKSTRLNSSHVKISYAVFCLKKKKKAKTTAP